MYSKDAKTVAVVEATTGGFYIHRYPLGNRGDLVNLGHTFTTEQVGQIRALVSQYPRNSMRWDMWKRIVRLVLKQPKEANKEDI